MPIDICWELAGGLRRLMGYLNGSYRWCTRRLDGETSSREPLVAVPPDGIVKMGANGRLRRLMGHLNGEVTGTRRLDVGHLKCEPLVVRAA
ncbi:hypothetical protein AVEN_72299-1 [Araneus ventricosus]|uniref:Uncharacterized protein n=1 Tax=Araneus ventricosus TaxID=182803 RepID=A0A4Y2TFG0_ARAVE|nr:hypothetical protein AVEN_72299-1 [Araneus ventricosus]